MKELYLQTANRLATLESFQWIDLEMGQLDYNQAPLPISLPCAIINVELVECESLSESKQKCKANVTIRMAFDNVGHSNHSASEPDKNSALAMWDTVDAVYTSLQGWEDTSTSFFERISQSNEIREDGIKVVKQVWSTSFEH